MGNKMSCIVHAPACPSPANLRFLRVTARLVLGLGLAVVVASACITSPAPSPTATVTAAPSPSPSPTPTLPPSPTPSPTPTPTVLFETIAQEQGKTGSERGLSIFIAGNMAEAETLMSALLRSGQSEVAQRIRNTPFDESLVLAVARHASSTGYSVTIQEIRVSDGEVDLVVTLGTPGSTTPVQPAEMRPDHIVRVSRSAIPLAPQTRWRMLTTSGETLAETTYP